MTRENAPKEFLARDGSGNHSRNESGNPLWRDGAMTQPSPLQSLSDHVASTARSPEAARSRRLASPRHDLEEPTAPDLAALLARRDADGRPAIAVQERLAAEAPATALAALGLLTMLRGRPRGVRDRLVRSGRVSALDAEADALAAAWEVVTRRTASRAAGSAERRHLEPGSPSHRDAPRAHLGRRAAARDFRRGGPEIDWPRSTARGAGPASWQPPWPPACSRPARSCVIASTRMEGRPLAEVAKALGRPYDARAKERRRAEAALRTFLARYDSGDLVTERPADALDVARVEAATGLGQPALEGVRSRPAPMAPGRRAPTARTRRGRRAGRPGRPPRPRRSRPASR